jgi:hypothetical protein
MRVMACVLGLVATIGMGGGCQKASDATQAKRMPQPPPPPVQAQELRVPDGLHIDVVVGGKPAPAIDAARLRATPPDFADAERHAWKMTTLVGPLAPGSEIVVSGAPAAGLVLKQPPASTDPQPVLMLNRRGDLVATMVTPNAPFPPYHGAGGRLGRPGDTTPHIPGVTRIVVGRAAAAEERRARSCAERRAPRARALSRQRRRRPDRRSTTASPTPTRTGWCRRRRRARRARAAACCR